jgi:hypothetical protein
MELFCQLGVDILSKVRWAHGWLEVNSVSSILLADMNRRPLPPVGYWVSPTSLMPNMMLMERGNQMHISKTHPSGLKRLGRTSTKSFAFML